MTSVLRLFNKYSPGPPGSHRYGVRSPEWHGPPLSFLWAFLCVLHAPPAQRRRNTLGCLSDGRGGEKQAARQPVPQPPGLPPTSMGRRVAWAPVCLDEGMVGGNEPLISACLMATKHLRSQTLSPSDVGRRLRAPSPIMSEHPAVPVLLPFAHPFLPLPNLP